MRARFVTTGLLALNPRAFGQEYDLKSSGGPKPFEEVGSIAVIHITGPLEQHPSWCWQDYETIEAQAKAAFASSCRAVALCINSPGGSAAGCFELSRALRAMSLETKKPLGVFVDGMAASAAYAIACSATAGIHAPPTSTVASLAVYEAIIDETARDQAIGVQFVFVPSSGADLKLTGNPHVKPSDAQLAHTQGQVDLLTDYFYTLVEEMRGIPQEDIRALRGATLLASQGVDRGLVNSLCDWTQFVALLESYEGQPIMTTQASAQAKAKSEGDEKKSSPWDEALATILGESQSGGEYSPKAKRMLAALMEDEEPDGDEKKDEADAKTEGKEEEMKATAAASASGAQATAAASSNELTLARQVQELLAKDAKRDEDAKRAALLASRPDFSAHIVKSLAKAPMPVVEDACKNWPRVTATPAAAAAAATPGSIPGTTDGAMAGIRPEQQALLARMGTRGAKAASARVEGTNLVLEDMSPEAASKRLAELQAQGVHPMGVPYDMARIGQTEFKVAAK